MAADKPIKVKWHGKKIIRQLNGQIFKNLERAATHFADELKETLSQPGHGRKYKVRRGSGKYIRGAKKGQHKIGFYHVASAPGEPPAVDTGKLRQSVFVNINRNTMTARIGVRAKYARVLEFGHVWYTGSSTRVMRPRPYMHPTFRREKQRLALIMAGKR